MKDVNNDRFPDKGNPRAPYFKENREKMALGTFINLFQNLRSYTSEEINYFSSAMCVVDKVSYRISSKMEEFEKAYNATNYFPFMYDGTLHNSCMRYDETSRNAADFYVNFAGAKILIAEDSQGQILGRAIVWNNVVIPDVCDNASLLDRLYFTFEFVRQGMIEFARSKGIFIRKLKNSVGTEREFYVYPGLKEGIEGQYRWGVYVNVPQIKWHKHGAPYMDTFCRINKYGNSLVLTNTSAYGETLATLQSTSGYGCTNYDICPNCGCVTSSDNGLCSSCNTLLLESTPFGSILKGKTKTWKGNKYPVSFFKDGKPTENFMWYIGLKRITNPRFKL